MFNIKALDLWQSKKFNKLKQVSQKRKKENLLVHGELVGKGDSFDDQ